MAEVSEQQADPSQQAEPAPADAPTPQEQAADKEPEPTPEATAPAEEAEAPTQPAAPAEPEADEPQAQEPEEAEEEPEPVDERPPEVQEADAILQELSVLASTCEETLSLTAELNDQQAIQKSLRSYAEELKRLPVALQMVHDLRRHAPSLHKRAEAVRASLVKIRGAEDALSSEEVRIIVSCASVRDTLLASVSSLEMALTHVRAGAHDLIALIGYHGDSFFAVGNEALGRIRLDLVSQAVHTEVSRMGVLLQDLESLKALEGHVEELQHA